MERGESIETNIGWVSTVSLIISASDPRRLVIAFVPSNKLHPEGRFSLPVRSIPTMRSVFLFVGEIRSCNKIVGAVSLHRLILIPLLFCASGLNQFILLRCLEKRCIDWNFTGNCFFSKRHLTTLS